jgi:AmmeMemoRadiSam system protein A
MSHYHPQADAENIDEKTLSSIRDLDAESLFLKLVNGEGELCGGIGTVGAIMAAKDLGANNVKVLKYATSGDVTGDKTAVVGYASIVIYKSSTSSNQRSNADSQKTDIDHSTTENPQGQADVLGKKEEYKEKDMANLLNAKQKKRLLDIAKTTIEAYVKDKRNLDFKEDDPVLNKEMGAFVTIHEKGELRGCIGNMIGRGPLYVTVRNMAIAAATQDPRFPPLRQDEVKDIDIEISVLSPMEKIDDPDKIVMGKHGVMVQKGFAGGVYLPQVATETGWSKEEFMNSLCLHKAGIPVDSWKTGRCEIYIFTAEVFSERETEVKK